MCWFDLGKTQGIYGFIHCRLYMIIVFGNLLGKILSYSCKVGIENVYHYHWFSNFFFLVRCLIKHILFCLFSLGINWRIADHIFFGFLLLFSLTMNFLFFDFISLLTLSSLFPDLWAFFQKRILPFNKVPSLLIHPWGWFLRYFHF